MKRTLFLILLLLSFCTQAQDSTHRTIHLHHIDIKSKLLESDISRLKEVEGTMIYSSKKNEVINVGALNADLSTNNSRQIFSKVAGVMIWENDGSGIQTGIATRGLSPNRSWEFNVRQNGYDISSEAFGYPEAYYSPPAEALEKIEVVRGAGALQYGCQFGGLLNYVTKTKLSDKPFAFESTQTIGSYGLFNTYNAIGGQYKGFSYYGFLHHRNADGWRENSAYSTNTGYLSVNMDLTKKLSLGMQYTHMEYLSQQAGGLTDSLFWEDPQQSLRSRNWFNTPWNLLAINSKYSFNENTKLDFKVFALAAERNSVGFTKAITTADTINTTLGTYNPRQVDRDWYNNIGAELRFAHTYNFLSQKSTISAGGRLYKGSTSRKQQGIGTKGEDFDLSIDQLNNGKEWGKELEFTTDNLAFFAENLFKIGKRISVTPGIRFELLNSVASGRINTSQTGKIEGIQPQRNILLAGIGGEYKINDQINLYSNITQGYRPVTYSQLTPSATTDIIDSNLKDSKGYNADFGIRGKIKNILNFDISVFRLQYDNRIGTVTRDGINHIENIGASTSKGLESFAEINLTEIIKPLKKIGSIKLYSNYSFTDARYTKWNNPSIAQDPLKSIEGKFVENAPRTIFRSGVTYDYNGFSTSFQFNFVDAVYTNAENTELPNSTFTSGKLPSYKLMDLTFNWNVSKIYTLKGGINNLMDVKYATRRASGYPGPGLLPGTGRTIYFSVGIKL